MQSQDTHQEEIPRVITATLLTTALAVLGNHVPCYRAKASRGYRNEHGAGGGTSSFGNLNVTPG